MYVDNRCIFRLRTNDDDGDNVDNVDDVSNVGKKHIDGLPFEINTHEHFQSNKMISGRVRIFL